MSRWLEFNTTPMAPRLNNARHEASPTGGGVAIKIAVLWLNVGATLRRACWYLTPNRMAQRSNNVSYKTQFLRGIKPK